MVAATAASLLGSVTLSGGPAQGLSALSRALRHPDPLVRLGALRALEGADASTRWSTAAPLLVDLIRGVRFAAARLLADLSHQLEGARRAPLDRAVAELLAAFELDADRAEAAVERANLLVDLGRVADAELGYARAVSLDPGFAPAYVNWCDLLRRRGDEAGCGAQLDAGLERAPGSAEFHYASALSLIRRGRREQAIGALRSAAELAPEVSIYAYALVLTLHERGDHEEAATILAAARARHPHAQALRTLESALPWQDNNRLTESPMIHRE